MTVGMLLLLSALALAVIIFGSGFYFRWVFQRMVMDKLQDLDTVRDTHLAPPGWQKGYLTRIKKGQYAPALWEKQRRSNLNRLRALEQFAKKTRLVEGENSREGVLRELAVVRSEWEALSPGDPL